MEFAYTAEQQALRDEVQRFIQENVDEDVRREIENTDEMSQGPLVRDLRKKVAAKGWVGISWPKEYGGQDGSRIDQYIVEEEFSRIGVGVGGAGSGAPAILAAGTEEQKKTLLPGLISGEITLALGFTEPQAGADLASLQCRAVRDGDDFVINGQKMYTSSAHYASHIYLMARTDPDAPKHRGISVFILDMDTPGTEVRPIINMFDVHYFNQVFFENVRVPKSNMIGEKNRGWYVAATTLDFERSGVARFASNQRALEELAQLAKEVQVNGRPMADDPVIRNRIAELYVSNEAGRCIAYNVTWMQSQGLVPNREASVSKMMGSEISQKICDLGIRMVGMFGTLDKGSKWAYLDGRLALEWMDSISLTLRGGTSEIQRNIIATRGLGLPRG